MPDLTPHAAAFLRDASPDDVASLLAHLLHARGNWMAALTPSAAAFLHDASPDDLIALLAHVIDDSGEWMDLTHEESGHRVAYFELAPEVYIWLDIEKDVVQGAWRANSAEVRSHLLEAFGGYQLGRAAAFKLGVDRYDTLPLGGP